MKKLRRDKGFKNLRVMSALSRQARKQKIFVSKTKGASSQKGTNCPLSLLLPKTARSRGKNATNIRSGETEKKGLQEYHTYQKSAVLQGCEKPQETPKKVQEIPQEESNEGQNIHNANYPELSKLPE